MDSYKDNGGLQSEDLDLIISIINSGTFYTEHTCECGNYAQSELDKIHTISNMLIDSNEEMSVVEDMFNIYQCVEILEKTDSNTKLLLNVKYESDIAKKKLEDTAYTVDSENTNTSINYILSIGDCFTRLSNINNSSVVKGHSTNAINQVLDVLEAKPIESCLCDISNIHIMYSVNEENSGNMNGKENLETSMRSPILSLCGKSGERKRRAESHQTPKNDEFNGTTVSDPNSLLTPIPPIRKSVRIRKAKKRLILE